MIIEYTDEFHDNLSETRRELVYQESRDEILSMYADGGRVEITAIKNGIAIIYTIDPADLRKFLGDNFPEKEVKDET